MRSITFAIAAILAISTPHLFAQPATMPSTQPTKPLIQVCFVLDTTGSMGGLIEGAKAKIWSIANDIVRMEPRPDVQIALVGYRDRGDEYITRVFDLTDDIDTVYKNLYTFKADGGGDTPESVNQAMYEAVTKIHWNPDRSVSKFVFLVGDAPPHMDYPDDVKYPDVCQQAVKKDLIINTVQCGTIPQTAPIWQEIARLGEGGYVAIGQTGDMLVTTTPYDKDLAELNVSMNATVIVYGDARMRAATAEKVAINGGVTSLGRRGGGGGGFGGGGGGAAAAADRATFNVATEKAVQGRGDLLDDLKANVVSLESLPADQLPPEIQKLSPEERKAYLDKQSAERDELRSKIADLVKKRQEFLDAERKRIAEQSGNKDAFDSKVAEMIREQSARKRATPTQ